MEKQLDLEAIKICSHQSSRSSLGGKSYNRSNMSTSKIKRDGNVLLARSKIPLTGWLALNASIYFTPDVFFKEMGFTKQRDASAVI